MQQTEMGKNITNLCTTDHHLLHSYSHEINVYLSIGSRQTARWRTEGLWKSSWQIIVILNFTQMTRTEKRYAKCFQSWLLTFLLNSDWLLIGLLFSVARLWDFIKFVAFTTSFLRPVITCDPKISKNISVTSVCASEDSRHISISFLLMLMLTFSEDIVDIMYRLIPKSPITPRAFDFFEKIWSNSPLCRQVRRSNAPPVIASKRIKSPTLQGKENRLPLETSSAKFSATTNFLFSLSSLHKDIFHDKTI